MLERINNDKFNGTEEHKLVSRKIFYELRNQTRVKANLSIRRDNKGINFVKKLPQKWRWRWNRKTSKVWKQVRFLRRYNVNGLQVLRVDRYFGVKRVWDKMWVWKYRLKRKSLEFNSRTVVGNRLDWVLIATLNARNITKARSMIKRGMVLVNGLTMFDYNAIIRVNDIVQVRNNIQSILSPISQKLFSITNARRLWI